MPPSLVHSLTGPVGELTAATVACGARDAALATWDPAQVTCPACQRGCTCGPALPVCPSCRTWNAAHRGRPTHRPVFRSEKAFQEHVRQLATAAGWLYFHCHDARKSPSGFPDTVCVRLAPDGARARVVFAELKLGGKTPTSEQARWLEALGQVTQPPEVFLWYPTDLTTIEEVLR